MTTFARIAKILKGLVEPRNWVEEAFSDIEVKENKFHIKITGEGTQSGNYTLYKVLGNDAANAYNILNQCAPGDQGTIEIEDILGNTIIFPVAIAPRVGSRISVMSSSPVLIGIDENRSLYYEAIKGSISASNGTFYVTGYAINPISE